MDRAELATDAQVIRLQLERILASRVFFSAQRSQAFLRYAVEKSIAGQVPKEYEIAVDVFERSPDYDPAVDATVRVEASRLRARLREYYDTQGKHDPILIEIPKGGYSAVCTHTGLEPDRTAADSFARTAGDGNGKPAPTPERNGLGAAPAPAADPVSAPVASTQAPRAPRRRALVWLSLSLAVLLVLALSVGALLRWRHAHAPVMSIAVLPLKNFSGNPAQDYFAAGMTDELTTELARVHGLRVVSRTSAELASRSQKSLPQIAEALKVDAVVEGSVLRVGDKIRITAQLIDARTDRHLWAQSFEGQASDILTLQDTVADEIAAQTQVALTPADRTRLSSARSSINPEAYDDYLRGLYFIERREGEKAAQSFQSALDIDPNYAPAWSGLAQALTTEVVTARARADDVMPSALQAAKRAVQIDPSSGEAYIALGFIEMTYPRDWAAAERDLRKGIALSPGDPLGHVYLSICLMTVKRTDEAVVSARRALDLDPLDFFTNRNLATILFFDRHYDESLAQLRRTSEISPDRPALVQGWNSAIYEVQGRFADAVDAELRGLASSISAEELHALRSAFASGGWKGYQQARIRFLLPRATQPCDSGPLAMSYLRLGNVPEAFKWFQREADEHCVFATTLAADPRLDPFRHDPHYLAFQDELNLPH